MAVTCWRTVILLHGIHQPFDNASAAGAFQININPTPTTTTQKAIDREEDIQARRCGEVQRKYNGHGLGH